MRRLPLPLMSPPVAGYSGMHRLLFLSFCCLVFSCGHGDRSPAVSPSPKETPKALQEESYADQSISKRGAADMVENLYQELAQKDSVLITLEARLAALPENMRDSAQEYHRYNDKNNGYYGSAAGHTRGIRDSVLRKKMEAMIAESDTAYGRLTEGHRSLLTGLKEKDVSLNDLHEALKLTRTLPLITKYQRDRLPGTGPLLNILKEYQGTEGKMAQLVKQ